MSTAAPFRDVTLLLARVLLGVVLVAHGWQKLDGGGVAGTADGFAQMGIPAATAAAVFAIGVEVVGGALLVLGVLTRVIGVLVLADMAGAFWYVHRDAGVFVADGGWELVAVIGVLGLALAGTGAGRISVDGLVGRLRGGRRTTDTTPAAA
ncbi:hypothetical protein GCM10011519_30180 [Marmoricola endophyticus]|uniref:DoxX family protein n=1 Tax=Marmoricola endophyticus TaxID=2040280 RepID=A0A917F7W3_9ACTN|nr:DoxX family protein [Marmoricola endophyticus]GGF54235.1 hypothetical protein GCM10011519_30180 [Marmoricola endophyticus]